MKKLVVIPLLLLTASCATYYPYYAGNYYAAYPGYGYYQAPYYYGNYGRYGYGYYPSFGFNYGYGGGYGVVIRYMDGIMVVAMEGGTAAVDGMVAVLEGDFTAVIDKKMKFYPVE